MQVVLEPFFAEYQRLLKFTKAKYNKTQKRFIFLKSQRVDKELIDEMISLSHSLFQASYLLMESHLHIKNIYDNYSDEEKKIIDEYDNFAEKCSILVADMLKYTQNFSHLTDLSL